MCFKIQNLHKVNFSKSFLLQSLLIALFPIQLILIWGFKTWPYLIEDYYTPFYNSFSQLQFYSLAWIPFSIGDLAYLFLIVWLLRSLFIFLRYKANRRRRFFKFLAFLSLFYALFNLSWGFNYYKVPLDQQLGMTSDYAQDDLIQFTCQLIQEANASHRKLSIDDTLAINFNFSQSEVENLVYDAYQSAIIPKLYTNYPVENIKASLLSIPLSYAGFSGYLNPFTKEAQFNSNMPSFKWPTTIAHEVSHQLGFAKENEANFMSAVVCIKSKDPYLRYAGLTFALKYSLNDISISDPELFEVMLADVNVGILENYKASRRFWERYQGPSEVVMKIIYSNFLKANNQPKGIETYNYVVALLVNYHKNFALY